MESEGKWEKRVRDPVEIRKFFDRVGPWFYAFFFTLVGYRASLRHFVRDNHKAFGACKGLRVLDAGIGTGFLSASLLQEIPARLTVTGMDFSLGMWICLRRWLRTLHLEDRVKFVLADMRAIPFRSESFDLVCSSAALEYLRDEQQALTEFCRVLRPGGRLLIITTRRTLLGKLIAWVWRNRTYEEAPLTRRMREAGFRHVRRLRFPWYFPHVNGWGMALLGEKGTGESGCLRRPEES